jgi:hypothetical protein
VFVDDAFGDDADNYSEEGSDFADIPPDSKLRYTDDIEDFGSNNKTASSKKDLLNKKTKRPKKNIEYEYEEEYDNKLKHKN